MVLMSESRICASLFFLVLTRSATADPSATFSRLMNQPASLFDVGLLRAELRLEEALARSGSDFDYGDIDYDFNRNLILITFWATHPGERLTEWQPNCATLLSSAFSTVSAYIFDDSHLFSHRGRWRSPQDAEMDAYSELRQNTEISIRYREQDDIKIIPGMTVTDSLSIPSRPTHIYPKGCKAMFSENAPKDIVYQLPEHRDDSVGE